MCIITCLLRYYIMWWYKNRSTSTPSSLFERPFQFLICVRVCVRDIFDEHMLWKWLLFTLNSMHMPTMICVKYKYKYTLNKDENAIIIEVYTAIYILYCHLKKNQKTAKNGRNGFYRLVCFRENLILLQLHQIIFTFHAIFFSNY